MDDAANRFAPSWVTGLAAKPRIDILVSVASSADEASYGLALESAGYPLCIREPDWHEHRVFKGPDVDLNLHVLTTSCSEIERMLTFRDWLRARDDDEVEATGGNDRAGRPQPS